ncbi:rRNA maturation RNase YbeY [Sphingomicrobium flavum]|uniref:rRNA maturation RNase YbeY n=1 Tax=Sphingomicrobium flavum TaxID=1229164 RepID=UPI0021AE2DE1|nr:rRNA maturation RNase YbeY [Sphingomicrobium flavum]
MIEISLDADPEWDSRGTQWEDIAEKAALAAVHQSAFTHIESAARPVEISLKLAKNDEVQALNAQWRGKDKPTNVLSFPMANASQLEAASEAGPALLLGDMILAFETCRDEADDKGIGFVDHATHLMVHGVLHLLGYDHMDDDEAEDMEAREIRALEMLGIANPYSLAAEAH